LSVENGSSTGLRCANHPETVTYLRCSRCGKPICPKCVVQTPVGGRCKECARVRRDPALVVGSRLYLRATAYGLGVALVGGLLWSQVGDVFGLSGLLLILLGYAVGEAVSRGANRKVSRGLMVMAGGFTVLAVVAGRAAVVLTRLPDSVPLDVRLVMALDYGLSGLFTGLFGLLLLVLAVVIATSRVR